MVAAAVMRSPMEPNDANYYDSETKLNLSIITGTLLMP